MREAEGMTRTWKVYVEEKLMAVIDNKHVLLPWLVMHAGVIITRYKRIHDGKSDSEKVVRMIPKDHHRRNKLDPIHQFGVFTGIVPRTGEFVVLTLEGAVAARTVHRFLRTRSGTQNS